MCCREDRGRGLSVNTLHTVISMIPPCRLGEGKDFRQKTKSLTDICRRYFCLDNSNTHPEQGKQGTANRLTCNLFLQPSTCFYNSAVLGTCSFPYPTAGPKPQQVSCKAAIKAYGPQIWKSDRLADHLHNWFAIFLTLSWILTVLLRLTWTPRF